MNDELATYLAELAERDPNKADALSRRRMSANKKGDLAHGLSRRSQYS
ncbi:hypothetical protein ACTO5A_32270 [Pseudomonas aeruginosa]